MLSKIFENKIVQMIFAVAVSIAVWSYVVITDNPQYTENLTVTNIEYAGMKGITDNDLYMLDDLPRGIEVRVTGSRNLVTKITNGYSAKIDFSGIYGAGEYDVPVTVTVPSGVTLKKIKPETIHVSIDTGKTRHIPTSVNITGEEKNGFEITPVDKEIAVSGPSSIVSKIAKISVEIDTKNITDEKQQKFYGVAVDSSGEVILDERITFDNSLKVDVKRIKEVPIAFTDSDLPEAITGMYETDIHLNKKFLKVYGEKDALEKLEKLKIDVRNMIFDPVLKEQEITGKVILPEGITLGENGENKVIITITYTLKEVEENPSDDENNEHSEIIPSDSIENQ
ncbi:MAG: hypothetical protein IJC89_03370 [Clostridia bacterium]|nr:hypothetical protein [Clostridia bacterium]